MHVPSGLQAAFSRWGVPLQNNLCSFKDQVRLLCRNGSFEYDLEKPSLQRIELAVCDFAPLHLLQPYRSMNHVPYFELEGDHLLCPRLAHLLHQTQQIAIVPFSNRQQMLVYTTTGRHLKALMVPKYTLVLDLDETLVRTRVAAPHEKVNIAANEAEFSVTDRQGLSRRCLTRMRPGVHQMLLWASGLFNIKIVTNGTRRYAEAIGRLLDPEHDHLLKRCHSKAAWQRLIVSREQLVPADKLHLAIGGSKSLKPLGLSPTDTVILDDDASVWCRNSSLSLLPFQHICRPLNREPQRGEGKAFVTNMRIAVWTKLVTLQTLKAHYIQTKRAKPITPNSRITGKQLQSLQSEKV